MNSLVDNPAEVEDFVVWTEAQAMKIYWSLESMTTGEFTVVDFMPGAEPFQRCCKPLVGKMVKLYDGDKTDEANLLGYAWGKPSEAFTTWLVATAPTSDDEDLVVLSSYKVGIWDSDVVVEFEGIEYYASLGLGASVESLLFYTYV